MKTKHLYEFGPFRLDIAERRLLRDGEPVTLTAKVFDLLALLARNRGRLLDKEELLTTLWPDSFVEEVNLSVNISALRKALGEAPASRQYIETIPKKGYRFVAEVREIIEVEEATARRPREQGREVNDSGDIEQLPAPTHRQPERRPVYKLLLLLCGVIGAAGLGVAAYMLIPKATPAQEIRALAVLPFRTASGSDADKALGMGMADALITRLSGLKQISVRPTSAVLKYAGAADDPQNVGRALQADALLEGLLQRDGNRIRVSVRLFRVKDGAALWAGTFDDFFTNVFALQDSISERMTAALSLRLTGDERQAMARRGTENTEAYQFYVQGQYYNLKYEFRRAVPFYQAAIEKDPDYATAYAGLATNYVALGVTEGDRREMRDRAMAAATRALSLAPELSASHSALGFVKHLADWDWPGAEPLYQRAIELNARDADARANYAVLLTILGRHEEGLREIEQAVRLDPLSSEFNFQHAMQLFYARRYDRALEQTGRALEIDPMHAGGAQRVAVQIYLALSQYERAIAEGERLLGPEVARRHPLVAFAYGRLGKRQEAEAILRARPQGASKPYPNYSTALIYAGLGDQDRALEWLEKAYQAREHSMVYLKVTPEWDALRSDARFGELLRRMRLAD